MAIRRWVIFMYMDCERGSVANGRTGDKTGGKQMFDDAKADLTEALKQNQAPITVDTARDVVDGGEIVAESAISQYATTADHDGVTYVTGIESGPSFDVTDLNGEAPSDGSDTAPEPVDDKDDASDVEMAQAAPETAQSDVDASVSDLDLFEVNGILITVDPEEELVGEPTGDDWYGLPKLTNGHDSIPNETTPYFPVEVSPGNRDSEEWMGRVLGEHCRPLLFEGEAGTGKNRGIARAASATNRPTQRTNFGSDVSVFDLVGEKEIADGQTYYILGDQARAAMFGHIGIWDEVNMVTGDTSSFLHGLAEEPGNRSLELRGTGVTLTDIPVSDDELDRYGSWYEAARRKWDADKHLGKYIHPEFRITATCNPLDYADTKSMNDAFRDRFVVVEHPYLDPQRESALLAEETGADPSDVRSLADLANVLREARAQANAHQTPITHRSLLKTVEMAGPDEGFMSFRDAALNVMVDHASTKKDKQYIRDTIQDEI